MNDFFNTEVNSLFNMGVKVTISKYPGAVFMIVQEDAHGWVLQVEHKANCTLKFDEGDIIYITHSTPFTMKMFSGNDEETYQNDEETYQNDEEASYEDEEGVVIPAELLDHRLPRQDGFRQPGEE